MVRDNPDGQAGSIVRAYTSAHLLWGHHTARRLGLSDTEFATLNLIALESEVTARQLTSFTGLSAAAISRLVDRLVERGFAARHADPDDRRQVRITRTEAWQAEIDEIIEPRRQAMREVLAEMPPQARATVIEFLAAETPKLRELFP